MKRLLIYCLAFVNGYRSNAMSVRRPLNTPLGIAEWWGFADGIAFRTRLEAHPFCRCCGYKILEPARFDPNLGVLCKDCGHERDVEAGRKLLEN